MRCRSFGAKPVASRRRRRSWLSEMYSSEGSDVTSRVRPGSSSRTASEAIGSGSGASARRPAMAASSFAAASHGDAAAATASPSATAERPHRSSAPTDRSTSSDAGTPSTDGAAPGVNRTPTLAAPGASVYSTGPVCGPTTRGIAPTSQRSSALPFGTGRCV
jgi:hypothetical protein